MTFGEAITAMKNGKKVKRADWSGTNIRRHSILGDEECTLPYIVIDTMERESESEVATSNGIEPYVASHADMLAEDWEIVE